MKVILGSDHGGFGIKEEVKKYLIEKGVEVSDVGNLVYEAEDDYPDYAWKAMAVYEDGDRIILFCRNGFGMLIASNRDRRIRCGLGFDLDAVSAGRADDDINCLAIPADYIDGVIVKEMVDAFLTTKFKEEEKYIRRISKIS
jgi:ribose 5-phosphate isomerase B